MSLKKTDVKGYSDGSGWEDAESKMKSTEISHKSCVFVGRTGSGKTSLNRCLTGGGELPAVGLEPSTLDSSYRNILLDNIYDCKIFDTIGFVGDSAFDYNVLMNFTKLLGEEEAKVNIIFLCFAAERWTMVDTKILSFVREYFSKGALKRVMIVITHCANWNVGLVKTQVNDRFGFLGDLNDRVMYFNLNDPRDFTGEAKAQVLDRWSNAKATLQNKLISSNESISVKKLIVTFWDKCAIM